MSSLKREAIDSYKIIKENNGLKRVEIDNNQFKTVIATDVRVIRIPPEKYEAPIQIEIYSDSRATKVVIWDRTKKITEKL